ncbi:MAG: hypothetical protein ACE5NA_04350 [Nitrospiraceae bacterium]
MPFLSLLLSTVLLSSSATRLLAEGVNGVRPLLSVERAEIQSALPEDTSLLIEQALIEAFLGSLDSNPPDWAALHGDHGAGQNERLFALNRERDRLREGQPDLGRRITFLWYGQLSGFDRDTKGFRVAIGPKFTPTRWGLVRFKPANLPSYLIVVPPAEVRESLHAALVRGDRIELSVAMTGRLIPEESIMYAFAHDEPGQGLVMPVVRIERIDYLSLR